MGYKKIIAINEVTEMMERNVSIAIEYEKKIGCDELKAEHFSVENRFITKIYTNTNPFKKKHLGGHDGNFVILELDYADDIAITVLNDWNTEERKKLDFQVCQLSDITCQDGTVEPAWEEFKPIDEMKNEKYDKFQHASYYDEIANLTLSYSLYIPEPYEDDKEYPLILYWHGGGEKGNKCIKPILNTQCVTAWLEKSEQKQHPCFILVPQCPLYEDWIDPDTYETTNCFHAICRLLFSTTMKYKVNRKRIYCTGFSMGGMAAWEITKKYPDLFAATLIYAGQDNYEGIESLKNNNIWVFHGEDDDKSMPGNVDIMESFENEGVYVNEAVWDGSLRGEAAEKLARMQVSLGGHILHTQYKEGSIKVPWAHIAGWRPVCTNRIVREWMFSKVNNHYSLREHKYQTPAEYVPVRVGLGFSGNDVLHIAAGNRHNLAVLKNGDVYGWGFNLKGETGNGKSGSFLDMEIPHKVVGLRNIRQVAAGNNFSLALTDEKTVYGWGSNSYGQLGNPDIEKNYETPVEIWGISNVRKIGAGDNYSVALREDGTVWAWGSNIHGQLGDGTYNRSMLPLRVRDEQDVSGYLTDIVDIEVGVRTVLAMKADGTLRAWGDGEYGQLGQGYAVHCPGYRQPLQAIDPADSSGYLTQVAQVAAGRCFTAVRKKDGSIFGWGLNRHGEIGIGRIESVLKENMDCDFNTTITEPVRMSIQVPVIKITAGMNHMLALSEEGKVFSWGYNRLMNEGVLGLGTVTQCDAPTCISELSNICDIYTGLNHNFAIGQDGSIWAWGNKNNARLGSVLP